MQFWKFNFVLVVLVFSFDHIRSSPQRYAPVADADEGVNDTDQGVDDSDDGVNDADESVNDADQGVDDADEGVDDADERVNDADQGVDDADEDVNDADTGVGDTAVGGSDQAKEEACLQEHEEYQSCGTSCPDTCDNYVIKKKRPCFLNCNLGCFCKAGYIRNLKDNTCIKPEQCPETPPARYDWANKANKKSEIAPISHQCKPGEYFYMKDCNICYCYAEGTQGCTNVVCKKDTKMTLLGNHKQTLAYKKLRDTATACVPGEKFISKGCNCNCVIPSVITCDKSCVSQGAPTLGLV